MPEGLGVFVSKDCKIYEGLFTNGQIDSFNITTGKDKSAAEF